MQLSTDVIDAFREQARILAKAIYQAEIPVNKIRSCMVMDLPKYEITVDALVCKFASFSGPTLATISYKNIHPSKISDLRVSEPEIVSEDVKQVELRSWYNDSSEEERHNHKTTETETITQELDILAEIENTFRGKVSAGYGPVKGELENQLRIKLGAEYHKTEQHSITSEDEVNRTIPPWTHVVINQEESESNFRQTIDLTCEMDAEIIIDAGFLKTFSSRLELEIYFKGGGGGDGNAADLDEFVNRRLYSGLAIPSPSFHIQKDREYKNAKKGEVTRTDTPIEH